MLQWVRLEVGLFLGEYLGGYKILEFQGLYSSYFLLPILKYLICPYYLFKISILPQSMLRPTIGPLMQNLVLTYRTLRDGRKESTRGSFWDLLGKCFSSDDLLTIKLRLTTKWRTYDYIFQSLMTELLLELRLYLKTNVWELNNNPNSFTQTQGLLIVI